MTDRQQRIRDRAYELWQRAGEPDGAPDDHWHKAEREIEAETGALATDKAANLDAERTAAVNGDKQP